MLLNTNPVQRWCHSQLSQGCQMPGVSQVESWDAPASQEFPFSWNWWELAPGSVRASARDSPAGTVSPQTVPLGSFLPWAAWRSEGSSTAWGSRGLKKRQRRGRQFPGKRGPAGALRPAGARPSRRGARLERDRRPQCRSSRPHHPLSPIL